MMGCPYIRNKVEPVMTRNGPRTITTGGATHCPDCDGTNITMNDPKYPNGCVCKDCGYVLCAIPKC